MSGLEETSGSTSTFIVVALSHSVKLAMTELAGKQMDELKKLWINRRPVAFQVLKLAMVVLSALMMWKSLMVVTNSESPVVVVLR